VNEAKQHAVYDDRSASHRVSRVANKWKRTSDIALGEVIHNIAVCSVGVRSCARLRSSFFRSNIAVDGGQSTEIAIDSTAAVDDFWSTFSPYLSGLYRSHVTSKKHKKQMLEQEPRLAGSLVLAQCTNLGACFRNSSARLLGLLDAVLLIQVHAKLSAGGLHLRKRKADPLS
jgi:peptidoglycan hydrolase-like amidase